ncbi:hypothetical protein CAV_0324 [Campylobacter avium LMG 24591]|uniref:Uncharacterized protein n=1 Tax=Campylobacter avium LMG 24591 TaxID=522484 RepID=A0A222MWD1_9BACT|nr:hypothetical protein [Campylobacter avium]ASQ29992.1 hypothetical protein CAV_0324 [Campylobacter avium LMG 24591]OYD79091.1 hypothetical protein CAV8706_0325 [Campylobacter avium]HJE65442.1 hypothetical protein [Campylobacter avium]
MIVRVENPNDRTAYLELSRDDIELLLEEFVLHYENLDQFITAFDLLEVTSKVNDDLNE